MLWNLEQLQLDILSSCDMAMNAKDDAVSMTGTSETTTIGKVLTRYPTSVAGNDDDNSTIWKTIKNNPVILLCCLYANLGAFMYGFDNITLSLCLDMAPFVLVMLPTYQSF